MARAQIRDARHDSLLLGTGMGPRKAGTSGPIERFISNHLMPSVRTTRPESLPAVDLCQSQIALRAVLASVLMLAVGVALDSSTRDVATWWASFSMGCALTVPAVLSWLVAGCMVFRRFADQATGRALAAVVAGAVAAVWPWLGWQGLQGAEVDSLRAVGLAAAGALSAAAFTVGLRYRQLLMHPAHTSTRLAVLQARIRPHFLFNTLNTVMALVRVDPAKAESVLADLSDLFRAALTDSEASVAMESTLGQEIDLGRRYLAIEQLRFGDRMRVIWDLDPAAENARLPPLMLQPLLENAVRHGVEPSAGRGTVEIRTRREIGLVRVVITNSTPDRGSLPGHGMALDNLRERLVLMHGLACDFRMGQEGDFYRVVIQVPPG